MWALLNLLCVSRQEFLVSINGLVQRLSAVEPKVGKLGRDELLQFEGMADGKGKDLAMHARYVAEIIRGLQQIFSRRDLVVELVRTDMFKKHAKIMHSAVADVATQFWRLGVNKTAGVCPQCLLPKIQRAWMILRIVCNARC